MVHNVVSIKKMAPNVCRKTYEDLFLEDRTKKGLHDLCESKFAGKCRTTTFWGNLGKIPSCPKNSFAPTSTVPTDLC